MFGTTGLCVTGWENVVTHGGYTIFYTTVNKRKTKREFSKWFLLNFVTNNRPYLKYPSLSALPDKLSTTSDECPWKIKRGEAILVTSQECRNLPVSTCTRTLIAKDQEFNSKLCLSSVEASTLQCFCQQGGRLSKRCNDCFQWKNFSSRHPRQAPFYLSFLPINSKTFQWLFGVDISRTRHIREADAETRKSNVIGPTRNNCMAFSDVTWTTPHTN